MKNTVRLLAVLAALLIVYLVVKSSRDVTARSESLVRIDTTKVDGMIIRNSSDTIVLKKASGAWKMVQPVDYPVEARYVHEILSRVADLEIEALASESRDKDSLYAVSDTGTIVTVSAGSDTLTRFIVGKTAASNRHTFVRRVGEKETYRVKGIFTGQVNRRARDWRDKVILDLVKDNIERVYFRYPRDSFQLVKADSLWNLDRDGKITTADSKVVDMVLNSLARMRTTDFTDGDSARAVDFSSPALVVTATLDDGSTFRLSFVPQDQESNRYYVRKDGVDNTLFVVYAGTANTLMKKPDDFKIKS